MQTIDRSESAAGSASSTSPTELVASGLRLEPGQVEAVSPTLGDVHRVSNAFDDRVSISVHVYGADIGAVRQSVYAEDRSRRDFSLGTRRCRPFKQPIL